MFTSKKRGGDRQVQFLLVSTALIFVRGGTASAIETVWVSTPLYSNAESNRVTGGIDLQIAGPNSVVGSFAHALPDIISTAFKMVRTTDGGWEQVVVTSNTSFDPYTSEINGAHHLRRDQSGVNHAIQVMTVPREGAHAVVYGNDRTGHWGFETLYTNVHASSYTYSSALALDNQGTLHAADIGPNVFHYRKHVGNAWQTEDLSGQAPFSYESLDLSTDSQQNPILGFATVINSTVTFHLLKKTSSSWMPLQSVANPGGIHLMRIDSLDRIHIALLDATADEIRYLRLSPAGTIELNKVFPAPGAIGSSRCGLAVDQTDVAHIVATSVLINAETGVSTALPAKFQSPALALVNGSTPYIFGLLEDEIRSVRVAIAQLNRSSAPTAVNRSTNTLTWSWDSLPTPLSEFHLLNGEDQNDLSGALSPSVTQYTQEGLTPNTPHRVQLRAVYPGFPLDSASSPQFYTLALPPKALSLSRPARNTLAVSWQFNGNPAGTNYRILATPPSGVPLTGQTSASLWTVGSLDPSQLYAVSVRSVNGDGIEATVSSAVRVSVLGAVRETVFALNNGLSVTVQVSGPPAAQEPAIAVVPAESFAPAPDTLDPLGVGFRVAAEPAPSVQQSVAVTVEWPEEQVTSPSGKTLVLARYDLGKAEWIPLPTTAGSRHLTARTAGYGTFQIMAQDAHAFVDDPPQALPNPFRPGTAPLLVRGVPSGATLRIIDVRGRRVREITADGQGEALWDGANSGGDTVDSGIYCILWGTGAADKIRVLLKR